MFFGDQSLAEPITRSPSFRTPTVEVWRKTLSQIPTLFGRLVFLASLRDSVTGRYRHELLCGILGAEDCDRALARSHHQLFSEWLAYSLAEQKSDLDEYLSTAGGPRYFRHYHNLIPHTAREVERQLYLTDLETLMELLRYEHGGAA
jgi:hypothetical protein